MRWQRVGEQVLEVRTRGGASRLRHVMVREDAPWDWTCQECGYVVKAGSALDNLLARVRPGALPTILGIQLGEGGLASSARAIGERLGRGWQLAGAVAGIAAVAGAAAVLSQQPRAQPTATPLSTQSTAAVTEVADIVGADGAALAGRDVELDGVTVESVTGDRTFWVGSGRDERVFVVLDEDRQPEPSVTVRAGQVVRVSGRLAATPVEDVELGDEDRAALEQEALYIDDATVDVLEEASSGSAPEAWLGSGRRTSVAGVEVRTL